MSIHRYFLVAAFVWVVFAMIPNSQAVTCPLGMGEDELSLASVMRTFGRSLLTADRLAQTGAMDPSSIADEKMQAAISGIEVAVVCADVTVNNPQGKMLPSKANELSGDEREAYLMNYFNHMAEFKEALLAYRASFQTQLALDKTQRNFTDINAQKSNVREKARLAHEALSAKPVE